MARSSEPTLSDALPPVPWRSTEPASGLRVEEAKFQSYRPATVAVQLVVATGNGPAALAFDGTNIWVADVNDRTVSKLYPLDGSVLGTYPLASNSQPMALAFDGQNLWVSEYPSGVVKLRADGTQAASVAAPNATALA